MPEALTFEQAIRDELEARLGANLATILIKGLKDEWERQPTHDCTFDAVSEECTTCGIEWSKWVKLDRS